MSRICTCADGRVRPICAYCREMKKTMGSPDEIEIERWFSEDEDEEVHFFLKGDQRGAAYIAGVNPGLIPEDEFRAFLGAYGFSIPGDEEFEWEEVEEEV